MSFPNTINATAAQGEHYADTSDQKFPFGQKLELEDGRIFRYVLMGGTAIVTGSLYQGKASIAGDVRLAIVNNAAAVGDLTLEFTAQGSAAINFYTDGWVIVNKAAAASALGQTFKVKSHPVFAGATKIVTLDDDQPVRVIIAVADELSFAPSPWKGAIVCPITTLTSIVSGVGHAAITASQHGWLQTRGVCAMESAASGVVGNNVEVVLAAEGEGAAAAASNIDEQIGVFMTVADAQAEMAMVYLKLE